MSNRLNRGAILVSGIQYLERVDKDVDDVKAAIAELKAQIKELKGTRKAQMAELRAEGFTPDTVEQMIRERKMDPDERRRFHAELQVYRAFLGMLDGTPLGEAARQAFEEEAQSHQKRRDENPPLPLDEPSGPASGGPEERRQQTVAKPPVTPESVAEAKALGAEAARKGQSVTDNPYPATQDELRSVWDEGWCSELGSDGMEIPAAFRRPEKPEKPDDDAAADGGEAP